MKLHRELAVGAFDVLLARLPFDSENFVVIALAGHQARRSLRNNDAGRPNQTILQFETLANLPDHCAVSHLAVRLMGHGLVKVRIERDPRPRSQSSTPWSRRKSSNCLRTISSPWMIPAASEAFLGRVEAEFEIVQDGQQSLEERVVGVTDGLLLFTGNALAIVVKVRARAKSGILVFLQLRG